MSTSASSTTPSALPASLATTGAPSKFSKLISTALHRIRTAAVILIKGVPPTTVSLQHAAHTVSEMPQAITLETNLQKLEQRDWRKYFSDQLSGKGIEIGPLHRPLVTHPGMQVEYIDRYSVAQLRAHYPELNELPLVEPHIIGDAETFSNVPPQHYDFCVSAHVIEHMKNPIGAIENWCRVLKPGGKLYMIVPDKRVIFDKQRVRTTLEHIIVDYYRPSAERDFEHCLDYGVHVHNKKGSDGMKEADNIVNTNYSIHYHVFIPTDIVNLVHWFDANVRPLKIIEGPVMSPGSDEFHLLLQVP